MKWIFPVTFIQNFYIFGFFKIFFSLLCRYKFKYYINNSSNSYDISMVVAPARSISLTETAQKSTWFSLSEYIISCIFIIRILLKHCNKMAESRVIVNRPNSSSPPPNCAICLGSCTNKCFSDSCMHQFCFKCLLEWSKVSSF